MTRKEFEARNNVVLLPISRSFFRWLRPRFKGYWRTYRFPFRKTVMSYPDEIQDPMIFEGTLDHELWHVRQFAPWYGPFLVCFLYLVFPLPVGLSGRWFVERRAFLQDILLGRRTIPQAVQMLRTGYWRPWPEQWMTRWFERQVRLAYQYNPET